MERRRSRIEDKRNALSTIKRTTRSTASKTTAANVIKHQLKIADGKAYKINVPVNEKNQKENNLKMPSTSKLKTLIISAEKRNLLVTNPTQAPKIVRCVSENFLFRNAVNNVSSVSTEYEVVDSIETVEKQEDLFMEELAEEQESGSQSSLTQSASNDDDIVTGFKEEEDSSEFLNTLTKEGYSQRPKCINKEQTIKFGTKIRPKPRKRCGFVECFTNNITFCLTCAYCGVDFELWDWQQFIEHINEKHIPKRPPPVRSKHKTEDSSEDESQNSDSTEEIITEEQVQEDAYSSSKLEEDDVEEDVEMSLEESIENILEENVEDLIQKEELIEPYKDTIEGGIELYNEEDWQVDKLEEYENIEIDENGASIGNVDIDDAEENKEEIEDEELYEDEDEDGDYDDDENNDEDSTSQAVINLNYTDQNRVLAFLKLLRTQPMLWHPRRYGPPIYDEEMKIFLSKFDDSMSSIDFRRSVGHLRHQYKRFTPLTPRGRAKLQRDAYLRECIQIIKEIADKLSKPFAFHCDVCTFCFLDKDRMLTHKYIKHKIGDLQYICSCGTRFAYERQKEEHENMHKQKPRFTCKLCGSNFVFNRLLRDHMNEYHPETQENPLPYACNKCDEKFPSIAKRGHHMQRHRVPQYHCEICKQSFKTSFRYKHHLKRHQDQRDWVCEHCGKAFVEKRSLNAHLFRVHADGGTKCVHCRTYFKGPESLEAHNRKFHPEGTNLDHMKKIRKRIKRTRKPKSSKSQNTRTFNCIECGASFTNMWSLVGHKRQTGHNLQCYNCPNCEAVLSSPKTLMGHMRRIHKLPIATMAELRDYLLQTAEEEPLTAGEEEVEEDGDECLKLEEFEIFEAYDIE